MFKKKKSIKLSYIRQGLIYFICATYHLQPKEVQERIRELCHEVAGSDDYNALFVLLTSDSRTVESVSRPYYMSEQHLATLRKKFFEEWNRRYLK